jgi:hypothetical protein
MSSQGKKCECISTLLKHCGANAGRSQNLQAHVSESKSISAGHQNPASMSSTTTMWEVLQPWKLLCGSEPGSSVESRRGQHPEEGSLMGSDSRMSSGPMCTW